VALRQMSTARPRRSALFMPGSNAKALEKAKSIPTDCVILDLEDAVAPVVKESARLQATTMAKNKPYGKKEVVIRINGRDTKWHEKDVFEAALAEPDAILIPKVDSVVAIETVRNLLQQILHDQHKKIALWVMIESTLGVLHVEEITKSGLASVLVVGTNDLAKELHVAHTPERTPLLYSLSKCVVAARAYGLGILDGMMLYACSCL